MDSSVRDTTIDEASAIDVAMHSRPDLRAADEQMRAVEQQVTAIRAERLPSLSAYGDYGWVGKDRLLGTYDWGVQVSMPIFDGLRREGRIEEPKAVANEIDVRRRDLRQQAAIEVRGALLDLASAREQVDAVREALRLVAAGGRAGPGTVSRRRLRQCRRDHGVALAQLGTHAGGGRALELSGRESGTGSSGWLGDRAARSIRS